MERVGGYGGCRERVQKIFLGEGFLKAGVIQVGFFRMIQDFRVYIVGLELGGVVEVVWSIGYREAGGRSYGLSQDREGRFYCQVLGRLQIQVRVGFDQVVAFLGIYFCFWVSVIVMYYSVVLKLGCGGFEFLFR